MSDCLSPDPTKLSHSCPPAKEMQEKRKSQALVSPQQQGIFPCDGGEQDGSGVVRKSVALMEKFKETQAQATNSD